MQAPYETPPSSPRAIEEKRIRTAASGIFAPARPGTAFAETRERLIQELVTPPSPQPGN